MQKAIFECILKTEGIAGLQSQLLYEIFSAIKNDGYIKFINDAHKILAIEFLIEEYEKVLQDNNINAKHL